MPSRSRPNARASAVEGFAALPTLTRANALGQYLFVNGRPVRDKLLVGAVRAAYADYLPRDRHPLVALFVELPAREVDVNVHPAKAEVRFRNAGLVRALIVHALKAALARDGTRAATTGGSATIAAFRPRRESSAPGVGAGRAAAVLPKRRKPHSRSARPRPISAPASTRIWPPKLQPVWPTRSITRSGRRARKCTRPISWRKRATVSSSSISTPLMSASSMRN